MFSVDEIEFFPGKRTRLNDLELKIINAEKLSVDHN